MDARLINEKEFTLSAFRGYKINEVDDFLDEVAGEIDRLKAENAALQAQVAALADKEKRVNEMDQTLRDTLVMAQRAAEDVLRASREKAGAMIKDSELEGRRIVEEAERQAAAAVQRRESIGRDLASVKAMIRKVLTEQMRLLDETYPDWEPAQQASQPKPQDPAHALMDLERTQEFSAREVREQAMEEERAAFPRFRNLTERLPQMQDGDVQA